MPTTTHTVSVDLGALVGEVKTFVALVRSNSEDGSWIDPSGEIKLGDSLVASSQTNPTGVFTIVLPTSTGTGLQYEVAIRYQNPNARGGSDWRDWSSGWFDLTADGNLRVLAQDSSLRVNPSLAAQLAARIDGVQDHGDVSGDLLLDPATGFHVFDATAATTVELGDPPGYSIAFKAITGAENVTVDGLPDLELTDNAWSTFVYFRGAWDLAASGSGGGGTVEPVIDPPTQPGTITVDPTSDGYNLSWVASTVAAGYEVQIDGGAWVDSGSDLTHTFTGLLSGTTHSGAVRSYNSLGTKSTTRTWGPVDVDTATLHEQLLAYDAPLYMNYTNGALEDHSSVARTWNFNEWSSLGGTLATFDGPAISGQGTTSAVWNYRSTWRTITGLEPFANKSVFSAAVLFKGTPPAFQFIGNLPLSRGTVGNEILSNDLTIEHLIVWTWEDGVGGKIYRDGVELPFISFDWGNQALSTDYDNKGLWIGSVNKSYSGAPDAVRASTSLHWASADVLLSAAEIEALARAAGTYGNPR